MPSEEKPSDNTDLSSDAIQAVYGTSFTGGNTVTLLWKDKESFRSIFEAVRHAERIICLEFYIFRNDETGTELAEILKAKAAEGVSIYILHDHFGSLGTPMSFWKDLRKAGITIRASRPFRWSAPFFYFHRNHRKLLVIDGKRAFTGGLNIANEYRGYHRFIRRRKGWRDTGIFLEGPIATRLFDAFKKNWLLWKGPAIDYECAVAAVPGGLPVIPIFSSTARGRRKLRMLLYYSITSARRSIYLTTAYFTPSRRMLQILEEAVGRGVDVKLLLPGKSDVSSAHFAGRAFFTRLLKAGVEIHTYSGEILHAKTAVFDGRWSVIGSANLDFQSLRRNDEGNVGIVDEGFGRQMHDIFMEDLGNSERIELETWRRRPLMHKLMEHFFALFRRRL